MLTRPKGDGWWPRPALGEILAREGRELPEPDHADAALAAGMAYLEAHHQVADLAEELAQFARYYEVVLDAMYGEPLPGIAEELAEATVNEPYHEPFHDTEQGLRRLAGLGVRLGMLSNAWPSLDDDYRRWGLRDVFDVFVISSQVAMMKPQPSIYRLALDRLGVPSDSVVFIDDVPEYVAAAIDVGMHGLVMDRYGTGRGTDTGVVTNLLDVVAQIRARPRKQAGPRVRRAP